MATIIPWRINHIEPGPIYDAAESIGYFGDGDLPEFVPVRESIILSDGDDATHVNLWRRRESLYGQITPTLTPRDVTPSQVRLTVRWSVQGPDASQFLMAFGTYEGGDDPVPSGMIDGFRARPGTRTSADGIVTDSGVMYADGSTEGTLGLYHEDGNPVDAFRDDGRPVWLARFSHSLQENFDSQDTHVRIHDVLFEVHYDAQLPLRQVQRDDHLAPGGVARARAGSSRQGSIRQRGYY